MKLSPSTLSSLLLSICLASKTFAAEKADSTAPDASENAGEERYFHHHTHGYYKPPPPKSNYNPSGYYAPKGPPPPHGYYAPVSDAPTYEPTYAPTTGSYYLAPEVPVSSYYGGRRRCPRCVCPSPTPAPTFGLPGGLTPAPTNAGPGGVTPAPTASTGPMCGTCPAAQPGITGSRLVGARVSAAGLVICLYLDPINALSLGSGADTLGNLLGPNGIGLAVCNYGANGIIDSLISAGTCPIALNMPAAPCTNAASGCLLSGLLPNGLGFLCPTLNGVTNSYVTAALLGVVDEVLDDILGITTPEISNLVCSYTEPAANGAPTSCICIFGGALGVDLSLGQLTLLSNLLDLGLPSGVQLCPSGTCASNLTLPTNLNISGLLSGAVCTVPAVLK